MNSCLSLCVNPVMDWWPHRCCIRVWVLDTKYLHRKSIEVLVWMSEWGELYESALSAQSNKALNKNQSIYCMIFILHIRFSHDQIKTKTAMITRSHLLISKFNACRTFAFHQTKNTTNHKISSFETQINNTWCSLFIKYRPRLLLVPLGEHFKSVLSHSIYKSNFT